MHRSSFISTVCLLSLCAGPVAYAQVPEQIEVDIPAQPVGDALNQFAEQSGLQVVLYADEAPGVEAKAVSGTFEDRKFVLNALLASTGLEYEFLNERTVAVNAISDEPEGSSSPGNLQTTPSPTAPASTIEAAVASESTAAGEGSSESAADGEEEAWKFEEIVVTGSKLIDDPGKLTRQITIFNRAEIERSGATRLDEFLSRLPQNLNAPNNVGSGFAVRFSGEATFGLGENAFAGSSINLRGLGSQYTLILINGRRPARGGQFGTVTDISNIPIERIERIEILFDGAAAIYGADAIGGVVNIITNREYDGTSLTASYSDTDDGGGARYNLQLGHTFNWDSGSLTASVTYQTQDQIDGAQRPDIVLEDSSVAGLGDIFLPPSANGNVRGARRVSLVDGELIINFAPLMWVNGDQRLSGGVEVPALQQVFTGSGFEFVETTTIVDRQNPVLPSGFFWIDEAAHRPQDPETLGFTPVFQSGLPQYNGQALGLADLSASGELGENSFVPFQGLAISPEDETYSFALNFRQELSKNLSLALNLDYSDTYKASNNLGSSSLGDPNQEIRLEADFPNNPFLQDFNFAFQNVFPQQFQQVSVRSYNVSGGLDWDFAKDWSLAFDFGVSEQKSNSNTTNFLRKFGGGPDTLTSRLRGFHFVDNERVLIGNRFYDPLLGYASVEEMTDALVVPFMHTHNYSESYDADLRLTGKLFELPAGDVRSSLSLRYREDKAEIFNNNPLVGESFRSPLEAGENDYEDTLGEHAATLAGEFSIPVFGNDFKLPLVEHFLLSFSGSLEDYSNTDENGFNWAAGFNWGLSEEFIVRLNRTYNLRVPDSVRTAREPFWARATQYDVYANIDDTVSIKVNDTLWRIVGGADHLKPERNYGTALSFIYRPAFAKGLDVELSISESNTVDQLGNPWMGKWTFDTLTPEAVLSNPLFGFGDPENNPVHAAVVGEIRYPNGDTEQVSIQPGDLIFDAREFNVGDTFNRGADLQVRYNLSTGFGDWLLTWRHQYLDTNRVTRSNLCEQVETGCNHDASIRGDMGFGEAIDTVGAVTRNNFTNLFALPEHGGSIELFWGYRGLGMTLSTSYTDTTSVTKTEQLREQVIVDYIEFNGIRIPIFEERISTNIVREDTRPARSVDFTLSYDFGKNGLFKSPGWLENARVWLTVDRLFSEERKQSLTYLQQEFDVPVQGNFFDVNRLSINPRGRAYSLRFTNTF